MDYNTYEPGEDVKDFIKCYWTLKDNFDEKVEKQRIVPDGCMEMLFHSGDLYRQYKSDGSFLVQPKCFVFGQITQALEIEPTGKTDIFSARFNPEGFTPFCNLPLEKMKNRAVPLTELFGDQGVILEEKILREPITEKRIKIIEEFLLRLLKTQETVDRLTRSSVEVILDLNGRLTIDELAEQLKVNRRTLERRFSSIIGLGPKQLSKIIRLQATLKMLENRQFTSLTALAHEGGYFDQAHFINDFKEFTGMSPKQFYAHNLKMTSLFIGSE